MEKLLRKLAKTARLEKAPNIDVVDSVMHRISAQQIVAVLPDDKPFVWMASLSAAAAIAIGTFTIYAYYTSTTPTEAKASIIIRLCLV